MQTLRRQTDHSQARGRQGSVLIEFAFIAFAFYLLFAGTIELGRMITVSQAIQNAARVGAREMGLVALPPTMNFDQALQDPQVRARIYNPYLLAIDVSSGTDPDTSAWPVINQMLKPVMVRSRIGDQTFLHFPGAVLSAGNGQYTVGVLRLAGESEGQAIARWVPVVEEVRTNPDDPATGPFSLASTSPERGLVSIRINCPYQASTMVAYRIVGGAPTMTPIPADEGVSAAGTAPGTSLAGGPNDSPTYAGANGLGKLYAMGMGDTAVRPFRRLIVAQSMFRREVYGQ